MISKLYIPVCKLRAISELFYGESEGINVHFAKNEAIGISFILKEIADEIQAVKNQIENLPDD